MAGFCGVFRAESKRVYRARHRSTWRFTLILTERAQIFDHSGVSVNLHLPEVWSGVIGGGGISREFLAYTPGMARTRNAISPPGSPWIFSSILQAP